jgi:hypothetical protein
MKDIILKWYQRLFTSEKWGEEFKSELKNLDVKVFEKVNDENIVGYFQEENECIYNLFYFLSRCNYLEAKYEKFAIPYDILIDTLNDIVIWTENYFSETGRLGLRETNWLINHIKFNIFRLGRLQFQFGVAKHDFIEYNLKEGMPILAVHIPRGESLDYNECKLSYDKAGDFFADIFPDYKYICFTCNSWLLDPNLKNILNETSNIIKFQNDYIIINLCEKNSGIRFIFGEGIKDKSIDNYPTNTLLQKKTVEFLKSGGKLNVGYGVRK